MNPIPEFRAQFAVVGPERTADKSDCRAFFDPCAEIPLVELRLLVDPMGERLVGCEARWFEQGKIVCRERERRDGFSRFGKAVGERVLWGVERQPNIKWLQCLPRICRMVCRFKRCCKS